MATRNRKTNGKGSAEERKWEERQRQIEALPFVGTAKDKKRDFWAVPKRGGYAGGCMTGEAAAMAYLNFLRDNAGCGGPGMLQWVALDMFGGARSDSLRGQAVGFFSALDRFLRQAAPLFNIQDDDQIREEFERGLSRDGPRTAAYLKELHATHTENPAAKKDEAHAQAEAAEVQSMINVSPESLRTAQTILSLPSREQAIVERIMTRLLNRPPGAGPVTKEQVAGWLKAEGATESVIYSYLKSMEAVERSQDQP